MSEFIPKELIDHLQRNNLLKEFLHGYKRLVALHTHPDIINGSLELSARMNSTLDRAIDGDLECLIGEDNSEELIQIIAAQNDRIEELMKKIEEAYKLKDEPEIRNPIHSSVEFADEPEIRTPPESTDTTKRRWVEGSTYAQALHNLRTYCTTNHVDQPIIYLAGKPYYRPLTARETIEAKIKDSSLFDQYFDNCTSICYPNKGELIITPINQILITLPREFKSAHTTSKDEKGTRIKRKGELFDTRLSRSQASESELWLALAEGDKTLVETYFDMTKELYNKKYDSKENNFLGVWLKSDPEPNELRNVFLFNLNGRSYASCNVGLDYDARFLLVAH